MRRFIPLLLCVFMMFGFGQPLRQKIAAGNAHFDKSEYEDALAAYTDAQLHDPHSPVLFFNMGDVLYGQRKYNEAGAMYEKAREKSDPRLEFESLYNSGCTLYRQGKLKESLDMFKQALAKDPKDEDAKYNVEFVEQKIKEMLNEAQKRMEQQQQQQQQQQQSGSQQDQKNEQLAGQGAQQNPEEKKDEQKQGSDQEKEKGEEQKAEQKEPKPEGEQQQSAPKDKSDQQNKDQAQQGQQRAASDKEMSKEEAERYLDMLAMDDKMQQPAQEQPKTPYGNYRLEKDW